MQMKLFSPTQIDQILEKVAHQDPAKDFDRLISGLIQPNKDNINQFDFDLLSPNKIFHVDQIRKVCIDYRLRFLDLKYFKGNVPASAVEKICEIENIHETTLKGFKIMAPSILFRLKKTDDPLLFVPIGNGYYYLIHKWGKDLSPARKLWAWPFKNIWNLLISILFVSLFATYITPYEIFTKTPSASTFWMLYFFMFKAIASIVLFYGFALGKNFNPAIWNNRYNKS